MWSVWLVFCDYDFHSVLPLIKIRGLWKFPAGRDWLWGKLGLVLMDRVLLSKSLIQFSLDGQGCVLPYCLTWGQTVVEVMKIFVTSFKMSHACTPDHEAGHHRPAPPLKTPGHSQASLSQSLIGSLLLFPRSWCAQDFVFAFQESVFPILCKFYNQIPLASEVKFPGDSQSLCQVPRFGNQFWVLGLS